MHASFNVQDVQDTQFSRFTFFNISFLGFLFLPFVKLDKNTHTYICYQKLLSYFHVYVFWECLISHFSFSWTWRLLYLVTFQTFFPDFEISFFRSEPSLTRQWMEKWRRMNMRPVTNLFLLWSETPAFLKMKTLNSCGTDCHPGWRIMIGPWPSQQLGTQISK